MKNTALIDSWSPDEAQRVSCFQLILVALLRTKRRMIDQLKVRHEPCWYGRSIHNTTLHLVCTESSDCSGYLTVDCTLDRDPTAVQLTPATSLPFFPSVPQSKFH